MISRFSPAKANLFFRVLSKRPDGFHEVASLYTALSLGDFIHLKLEEKDSFSSNIPSLLDDDSNLIIQARDSFRTATGILDSVSIQLEKIIPIGAGLGGGSSNAATLLWSMNELFGKPLAIDQMITLGAVIGSDVPFFFSKGSAYCRGRGEILKEMNFKMEEPFWIAKPDMYSLSTPKVYSVCKPNEVSNEELFFINDLEPAAFRILPELKQFKEDLKNLGFSNVVMTGSGTAFLCFGDIEEPKLSNTTFYSVTTIRRELNNWYGDAYDNTYSC